MFQFNHFNFNVNNLEESLCFYKEAFGLEVISEYEDQEKGFKLVYLTDHKTGFRLELTYLKAHETPYDLGELEYHLALETDDFEVAYQKHKDMGIICYENQDMGIYFVEDPTGYWIEVVPSKKK